MQVTHALAAFIVVSIVAFGAIELYDAQRPSPGVPSTSYVTTSSQPSSLSPPSPGTYPGSFFQAPQHDLFRAQNLWWTFENNGTDVNYRTSPDGLVWSEPVAILTSTFTTQYSFATWVRGDTLYYAAAHIFGNSSTSSAPNFLYRYGTLEPNGNVSWAVASTQVPTQYHGFVEAITVDESGNVWAASSVANNTIGLEVYRNSGNDTSWVLTKVIDSAYETSISTLVPLKSGVALIYGSAPNTCCPHSRVYIITTSDGGRTWSSPVSPPSQDYYMSYASVVSMSDTVYFTAPTLSPESLRFWTYTLGMNSTSQETTLAPGPVADTLSDSGGKLVVVYVFSSTIYERTSADLGTHWSDAKAISMNEPYATLMTSTYSGEFGVLWNGAIWRGSEQIGHYAKFYSSA